MLPTFSACTSRFLKHLRSAERAAARREALPFWCGDMAGVQDAIARRVAAVVSCPPNRVRGICQSVAHLERQRVAGAVVEVADWRGGGMMAAALASLFYENSRRPFLLFDVRASAVERARQTLPTARTVMSASRYPLEKLAFVAGPLEPTLSAAAPQRIALLRLDLPGYASTWAALERLMPRLADGGVLLVEGATAAADDFFARHGDAALLHPFAGHGRLLVKGQRTTSIAA